MISTDARINLGLYLFADDTNILYVDKNLRDLDAIVSNDLQNLFNWLTPNKLTLNINKSNFVICHPYQKRLAYQSKLCMCDNERITMFVSSLKFTKNTWAFLLIKIALENTTLIHCYKN